MFMEQSVKSDFALQVEEQTKVVNRELEKIAIGYLYVYAA